MSDIKDCFISRFGNDGFIVEFDYSQLEVIALAELSGDEQLKRDIINGVDMHCMSASFLYDTPYDTIVKAVAAGDKTWEKRRKISKGPGFLLQYGGGAKLMARNTGLTVEACQKFIDNYYRRYSGVKKFQDDNIKAVEASRTLAYKSDKDVSMTGKGELVSVTGRRYTFWEYPSPQWKRDRGGPLASFGPTNIKNYPVQGFATGDIVPEMIGDLAKFLYNTSLVKEADKCLMINTIHDSVLFDMHKDAVEAGAIEAIRDRMSEVGVRMVWRFGIRLSLPFKVGVEIGTTWGDKQPLDLVAQ